MLASSIPLIHMPLSDEMFNKLWFFKLVTACENADVPETYKIIVLHCHTILSELCLSWQLEIQEVFLIDKQHSYDMIWQYENN